jgi:hypothetical protein
VHGESEHVIELALRFREQAKSDHTSHEGSSLENSSRVLRVQREQLTSSLTDAGQHQLHTPHLSLVLQAILANNLKPTIQNMPYSLSIRSFSNGRLGVFEVRDRLI